LAFGLLPVSDVDIILSMLKICAKYSVRNEFEGSGGLSKVNVGYGIKVFKFLSLGMNYSYRFGQFDESARKHYPWRLFYEECWPMSTRCFCKRKSFGFGLAITFWFRYRIKTRYTD